MKKIVMLSYKIGLFTVMLNSYGFDNNALVQERAHQQITLLKKHIKKEENDYKLAMQHDLSDVQKQMLTMQYKKNRQNLFQQIGKQRDIINSYHVEQWLWNSAKAIGGIALTGLVAYKLLKSSPAELSSVPLESEPQKLLPDIPIASTPIVDTQTTPIQSTDFVQPPLLKSLQPSVEIPKTLQTLTPEKMERYRKATNTLGKFTVGVIAMAPFFGVSPFIFYPIVAASYFGTWYSYLQLKGLIR